MVALTPILHEVIAASLAILFLTACVHKIVRRAEFAGTLSQYQVMPGFLLGPSRLLIPLVEAAIGIALLVPALRQGAAMAASLVLCLYGGAMFVNLVRGSVFDCGCHWGGRGQLISTMLVARNFLLALVALVLMLPTADRALGAFDYGVVLFGTLACVIMYSLANTLISNAQLMREVRS